MSYILAQKNWPSQTLCRVIFGVKNRRDLQLKSAVTFVTDMFCMYCKQKKCLPTQGATFCIWVENPPENCNRSYSTHCVCTLSCLYTMVIFVRVYIATLTKGKMGRGKVGQRGQVVHRAPDPQNWKDKAQNTQKTSKKRETRVCAPLSGSKCTYRRYRPILVVFILLITLNILLLW